jgi:hypothetical protein
MNEPRKPTNTLIPERAHSPNVELAEIPTGDAGDLKLDLSGISSLVIQSNLFSEFMS